MTVSKPIPSDLLNTLLSDYRKPEDLLGENGLLKRLAKALVEQALEAELTNHLGHAKHDPVTHPMILPGFYGHSAKRLLGLQK